ncbi:diguanylate phosphodiesterase [Enterobacter sp. CFBP8995]|nr:diguanylate phosphodiesterase [Enterobacter sp. CFBP8995]
MSNQPKTVFLLEPVYDLSGQVIAMELLTRLADDADINNKRNPERDVGFFSQLSADVKWQLFLHQIEKLIQLYQKGFDQIVSVNVDRDIVASIFKDAEIQEKLAQLTLLRLEISAFFTARFNSADLLILKGVAKVTPAPLWLDDFGPGYSNLSMFDSGIFEIVKIDKEFFFGNLATVAPLTFCSTISTNYATASSLRVLKINDRSTCCRIKQFMACRAICGRASISMIY